MEDITALFYDEERNEIYTGNRYGLVRESHETVPLLSVIVSKFLFLDQYSPPPLFLIFGLVGECRKCCFIYDFIIIIIIIIGVGICLG